MHLRVVVLRHTADLYSRTRIYDGSRTTIGIKRDCIFVSLTDYMIMRSGECVHRPDGVCIRCMWLRTLGGGVTVALLLLLRLLFLCSYDRHIRFNAILPCVSIGCQHGKSRSKASGNRVCIATVVGLHCERHNERRPNDIAQFGRSCVMDVLAMYHIRQHFKMHTSQKNAFQ